MEDIKELRNSLETFRRKGAIDSSSYTVMLNNLKGVESRLETVEKEVSVSRDNSERLLREKVLLQQEKETLSAQVSKLSMEKLELESKISVLQKSRPALSSTNLVSTFKTSLEEMDRGLKTAPSGTTYSVSSMNVTLKTNLALDGNELRFQMPKADDIISPENLSTIEFSLKAVPRKPDIASYREVPDLVGLTKEAAENKLKEAGFKPGEILEKESDAPEGTVLGQVPSGGSLAEPGSAVDLIIPEVPPLNTLKVPNLLGLDLESAKKVLDKSGLKLGGVREQPSDTKPGIVLAQSLKPGSEAEVDAKVFLMVSTDMKKEDSGNVLSDRLRRPGSTLKVPSDLTRISKENTSKASTEDSSKSTEGQAKVSTESSSGVLAENSTRVSKENPSGVSTDPSSAAVPSPVSRLNPVVGEPVVKEPVVKEVVAEKPVVEKPVVEKPVVEQPGVEKSGPKVSEPEISEPEKPELEKPELEKPELEKPELEKPEVEKPVVSETPKTETKTVPRVTGLPLEKAVEILKKEGVNLGKVSEIVSRISPGTVLNQSPRAGSIANPQVPVDLTVSKSVPVSEPVREPVRTAEPRVPVVEKPVTSEIPKVEVKKVPRVTGLPIEKAISTLESEGIKVGKVSEIFSRVASGIVTSQSPRPGTITNPQIPVDLSVSKGMPDLNLRTSTLSSRLRR